MKTFWNQPLPSQPFPDPVKAFTEKWEGVARAIPPDAETLTDEQKMAICIVMHVPILFTWDEGTKLKIETRYPVGFAKVDGKWNVFQTEA